MPIGLDVKKIGIWAYSNLLFPAAAVLVVTVYKIHWAVSAAVFLAAWHFLVTKPIRKVAAALNQAEYREWTLGTRFLSVLGWASTLGRKESLLSPHVSRDLDNTCERWWYRPDGVSDGLGGELPHSPEQAVVDFSRMTLTTTNASGTFNYELRWNNEDPFCPNLETRLVSKVLTAGGVTEFVDSTDWHTDDAPNGVEIAYRVYLRARGRRRARSVTQSKGD